MSRKTAREPAERSQMTAAPGDGAVAARSGAVESAAAPLKTPQRDGVADALCGHFQSLIEQLAAEATSRSGRGLTVGLTSSQRREGVSSMAAGLAVSAALRGLSPVLLVDGNLTNPAQDSIFETPRSPGLAEYLLDGAEPAAVSHRTPVRQLSVCPVGAVPADAGPLWEALRTVDWARELTAGHALVLVDLPALAADGPSASLAARLDGVLLVVEGERSERSSADTARRLLTSANAELWGVVLNKYRRRAPRWLERRV